MHARDIKWRTYMLSSIFPFATVLLCILLCSWDQHAVSPVSITSPMFPLSSVNSSSSVPNLSPPPLKKATCIRPKSDSVRGDVMALTVLLVTQPLSCIFASTGAENRALQQTLLWVETHQCGGCLELFRRLHKWPPWGSLHPHHVSITPYIVNSRPQKVTNLCTPFYGLAQVCRITNHYVIKYEWCQALSNKCCYFI